MCVLEVEASRLEALAVAVIHLEEAGEEGVVAVAEEAVITLLHAVAEAEEVGIVSRLHQPAMSIVAAAVLADTMMMVKRDFHPGAGRTVHLGGSVRSPLDSWAWKWRQVTIARQILPARECDQIRVITRIKENIENLESQDVTEETKKDDWEADETAIKEEKEAPVEKAKEEVEKAEEVEAPVNKDEEAAPPEIKEEVESSVQVTIQQNMDGRAVNEETVHKSPISSGKRFIRLQCPHCHERCITFKQYTAHLYGSKHLSAMSRLLLRQKQTVLRLRQQQRKQQREEEEREADSLTKFSSFCSVCKLNYRQAPITHTASKMHQEMKKLLFPYCKVCGILFKATLIYDKHICSLDHIRREAYMEERLKVMEIRSRSKCDQEGDEKELDMDGFMIVDSVGDVDDAEELEGDEKPEDKQSIESLVGLEFVKKVEALYCDLCQRYLPRLDDVERAQGVHCRSSQHIRLFMDQERLNRTKSRATEEADGAPSKDDSFNENEKAAEEEGADLEDGAEVHGSEGGEEVTENGKEEGGKDADDEQMAEGTAEDTGVEKEEEVAEEKLWADVDKDLGELLRDVDPEEEEEEEEDPAIKSSDDDESVAESGRYDRFRYSEKLDPAKDLEGKQEAIKNSDPVANDDTTK